MKRRFLLISVFLVLTASLTVIGLYGRSYFLYKLQPAVVDEDNVGFFEQNNLPPTQDNTPIVSQDTSQKFDFSIPPITNGLAPVLTTLSTHQPIVFLGIDDGANKQDFELNLMKDNNIKASLFLADRFMSGNPAFFKPFADAGSVIENHTLHHKLLKGLSYADQKAEICGESDMQLGQFGKRPMLFRPPGGSYDQTTQKVVADCGMKAVVLWIAKANGGAMQYQVGHSLRPGDIVLMHFRPEFQKDMQAFIAAEKQAGVHTELLEDGLSS